MNVVKHILALAVLGAVLAPVVATAEVVWIEYNYTTNPARGTWTVPGDPNRSSMLGPWDSWADQLKTKPLGNLYCIEANVYEPSGGFHAHTYTPYSTSNWNPPQGGTNAGLQWAAYLLLKVDPYLNSNSALTRAALQLAVWEALYDYNAAYTWDWTNGSFRVNTLSPYGAAATADQIKTQAAFYLDNYRGQYAGGTVLHDGQDLLRVDIPEPGSLVLLSLSLALGSGVVLWRRRRA